MRSILLVSHGSKAPQARKEIEALAALLKKRSGVGTVQPAFLEIESPDIHDGIRQCVHKGATEVTVLLNFLNSGRHAGGDIPRIIRQARKNHPEVRFRITKPIGQHDYLADILLKLIDDQMDVI